jgi:hypothetical protein
MLAIFIIMVAMILFAMGETIGIFFNRLNPFNDPRFGTTVQLAELSRSLFDVFGLASVAVAKVQGASFVEARSRRSNRNVRISRKRRR